MKHLNITFIFIVLLMNLVSFKAYAWFETIDGIEYELGDSKGAVVYSAPGSGHVSIPSSITYYGNEYPVYSINNGAFRRSKITSITLPNSLKYIGDGAFKNCTNLAFITIPDGIETIGSNTFWNCKSLISISLPNSLKEINNGAFKNCYDLTSVKIPNSVTKIGSEAFYHCI